MGKGDMAFFYGYPGDAHLSPGLYFEESIGEATGVGGYSEDHETFGPGGQKKWLVIEPLLYFALL
jgi:hypothetical protein